MGTPDIYLGKFKEIVFENRNKQYGAYNLRRFYNDRLLLAFICTITAASLLIASPLIASLLQDPEPPVANAWVPPVIKDPPEKIIFTIEKPKADIEKPAAPDTPKNPDQPKTPQAPQLGTSAPVATDSVAPSLPENNQMAAGTPTGEPPKEPGIPEPPKAPAVGPGTGEGHANGKVELVPEINPVPTCDIRKQIASTLNYPEIAKAEGVQGTVHVQFVVDENGNVTEPKVVKDIGYGCGDAALMAVKKLCRWKPGRMGDRAVKVLYTLPVKFKLN